MIRIAITQAAFEAIAKTPPVGSVAYEPAVAEGGLRYIPPGDGLSKANAAREKIR
jgi:hypothetical protein